MTKKQKILLGRIIAAAVLFAVGMFIPGEYRLWAFVVFLVSYAIAGWDIVWKAVRNIFRGKVFDENFLMSVATIGAFILGEYAEGVAVMLFYQVGEWFQKYAVGKSRRSIAQLMDIRPDYANLRLEDGEIEVVKPEDVIVGDTIIIKAGERVPLDGVVLDGNSSLDTSALTGESAPREVLKGQEVISGCVNLTGMLTVRVTKEYGESTVAKILDLVENSSSKKAQAENFISRFANYYTPFVCFAALVLALVPPLVTGQALGIWVYRALTFLVISCPCALVISIPLSFFGGIGGASKIGVLVKGSNYLEALAQTKVVVFDKTGTLTKGDFEVSEIHPVGITEDQLIALAAYAENYSSHPIAVSIKNTYGQKIDTARIKDVQEVAGHGVQAVIDNKIVMAGNKKMMADNGITITDNPLGGTVVHLALEGKYAGYILVEDAVKPDSKTAIARLKSEGIEKTVMLTGDNRDIGEKVAKTLGMDEVYAELLPDQKVEKLEQLLGENKGKGKLAFVGDGINDAPVLARADIGIAMGGLGSDAAIEAADVVIMTDEPSKISSVIKISQKTLRIAKQNVVFALGVKVAVLLLGAAGIATMWAAVFADVGVSILAILNAIRALYTKNIQ